MKRKKLIIERNSRVSRQRDPIPWKYCVLTVICGLLLVSGFFFAAKQHFTSIQVGMDNADLRMRIAKLKDENRKLLISKERASTPVRIAKMATAYGFTATPQTLFVSRPVNKDESKNPSPQPVIAFSQEKPVLAPSGDKAEAEKTVLKSSLPKNDKKDRVTDDQIASLRTHSK